MIATLEGPCGPSSFKTCSRACLGRSATVRVRALPNRNDMVRGYNAIVEEEYKVITATQEPITVQSVVCVK